eukprot:839132-Amphidinium_carterae.1
MCPWEATSTSRQRTTVLDGEQEGEEMDVDLARKRIRAALKAGQDPPCRKSRTTGLADCSSSGNRTSSKLSRPIPSTPCHDGQGKMQRAQNVFLPHFQLCWMKAHQTQQAVIGRVSPEDFQGNQDADTGE